MRLMYECEILKYLLRFHQPLQAVFTYMTLVKDALKRAMVRHVSLVKDCEGLVCLNSFLHIYRLI